MVVFLSSDMTVARNCNQPPFDLSRLSGQPCRPKSALPQAPPRRKRERRPACASPRAPCTSTGRVGPARTSMSAVAEHAGVQRSTLYRHFPDEAALFEACSAHWAAANPPPDPGAWAAIEIRTSGCASRSPSSTPTTSGTAPMLENLLRDEQLEDVLRERFQAFHWYLDAVADTLMAGPRPARRRAAPHAGRGRPRARVLHLALAGPRAGHCRKPRPWSSRCGFVLSPAR